MKPLTIPVFALIVSMFVFSCVKSEQDDETSIPTHFLKDHIQQQEIKNVRLADGAPITLNISYRWKVASVDSFRKQFDHPLEFDSLVLQPRAKELADLSSVKYKSIDSVFTSQREDYVNTIRQELLFGLGGNEAIIKEIIVTDMSFPKKYTRALEDISMKKKEIERIKQQALVDNAQSEANKKKAKLDGQVRIAQAESEDRLAEIKAKTEKNRRASQLALAETESQVQKMQARTAANSREIALEVELQNERKTKELDRVDLMARQDLALNNERQKNTMTLENERKTREQNMLLDRQQRKFDFDMEVTFAELCSSNPMYADYLVNKELASQVEIAILPTGSEMGVFENVIKNTMSKRQ